MRMVLVIVGMLVELQRWRYIRHVSTKTTSDSMEPIRSTDILEIAIYLPLQTSELLINAHT